MSLDTLLDEIRGCTHCAERFRATASAHEPRPIIRVSARSKIFIFGQAPGIRAHDARIPFLDPSGDRLRTWLGVDAETFYDESRIAIVPMAFCFPGHDAKRADLPPPKDCAKLWRARVMAELPRQRLTLLVGKAAQDWHLGTGTGMTARVRDWTSAAQAGTASERVPLPHPSWRNNAWLKANPWFETETLPLLRGLLSPHL